MNRLPSILKRLRDDRRGIATVEFAIWSTTFFMIIMVALDFAMYFSFSSRVQSAVEQGAIFAIDTQANLNTANIENYINTAAGIPGAGADPITITCNGTANCAVPNPNRFCLDGAAGTYTPAAANATCTGGSVPGNYMRIEAEYPYTPVLPNPLLQGLTIEDEAVVRLQ